MDQQKNEAPVSKVPWVVREPSNQALKDSRFFKEVMRHDDKQKTEANLQCYSLINNAYFPFYLPGRYHSMDCAALKNETKVEGHYWAIATHFFQSNQLHGAVFWQLTSEFGSDPLLVKNLFKSLNFLDDEKKGEIFKDGLELCKTSAEFLLDPWVLMQLPWQPVLMLQWTAGVLTEIYALRLEMVELHRWRLPFTVSRAVKRLLMLVFNMPDQVLRSTLHHMYWYFKDDLSSELYCENAGAFLNKMTQTFLPQLEFVTSGKARDIVRALKRMSFGQNFKNKMGPNNVVVHLCGFDWEITYNCLFSDLFWRKGNLNEIMGSSMEPQEFIDAGYIARNTGEGFAPKATPEWIAEMETKYGEDIKAEKIFGLLEQAINKGIATINVHQLVLLRCIESDKMYFTHCYYRLMELKANIEGGLRDSDAGVLYDVLYMRTKYRIKDVECAMIAKIADICVTNHAEHKQLIQLNALNVEGPDMGLQQINKIIAENKDNQKSNKLSGWKDLKRRVPMSCRGKVELNEECPDLEQGAQKVAQKFEDRIKRIVFNVFVDLETWSENQIKANPDLQFIQYILPCFVASVLEFAEKDDVEQEHKQNYVKIVHELIKGFEVEPYKVACMEGNFPGGYSPYFLANKRFPGDLEIQKELLFKGLQKALGSSPKATNVAETFDRKFVSVLINNFIYTQLDYDSYHYTWLRWQWRAQVYRLFRRILNAINVAIPGCLPNLKALDMAIIASICYSDYRGYGQQFKPHSSTKWNPIFDVLQFGTLMMVKQLLGVEDGLHLNEYFKVDNNFKLRIQNECKNLSLEQITALILYFCVPNVCPGEGIHDYDTKCGIRVPMDNVEEIFFASKMGDIFKLKLLLGKMFTQNSIDLSEVTYEFASKMAPLSYASALTHVKNNRVQMKPCELTLLPIKHCRWCGLVQHDALKLCEMCKDHADFPYKTWFCGDECERLALEKLHREEHERHLEIDLGLEKERVEVELESKGAEKKKKRKKKSGRAKKLYAQLFASVENAN